MSNSWTPLLSGPIQAQALETFEAITRDIATPSPRKLPSSVIQGHAGLTLLFDAAARTVDARYLDNLGEHLQAATQGIHPHPGLHGGVTGLGWVAAHLARRHSSLDVEDLCVTVDELLDEALQQRPWPYACDIRDGLAGIGLYALERMPHPAGRRTLEQVVALLDETAEHSEDGTTTWRMPPAYWQLHGPGITFPQGLFTVGVAHGVPPALAILAAAHALGIARERTQALLEGGFRWMARLAEPGDHPRFPHYLHGTERIHDERFAWCVGNPGITAVLLLAARRWGHPGWQERTLAWAEAVARESLTVSPSRSSNLCCGSAGTTQVYLRLFHETGRPIFADAATRWLQHTLALRQPGVGLGGYCFEQNPERPQRDLQFGAAGTALTLLAAASGLEPEWDRFFLFSLPRLPSPD